ncbi:MAG: hypothetical protein K2J46_11045, partial [Muribaculaceae bacterium]|nr:hypothetical protein [Muribaculaceae bacterium]
LLCSYQPCVLCVISIRKCFNQIKEEHKRLTIIFASRRGYSEFTEVACYSALPGADREQAKLEYLEIGL